MGRELKRVPLDFDYPLNTVWYGYYDRYLDFCHSSYRAGCIGCKDYARIKGIPLGSSGCPEFARFYGLESELPVDPPNGDGYQLWETTSEGSPVSPVFESIDALCEWCEENATTFADFKATKEQWKEMLDGGIVAHKEGSCVFL